MGFCEIMLAAMVERNLAGDIVFRALLVPVGGMIAFSGWRSIQRREFIVNRHLPKVRGAGAVVLGAAVVLFGIVCSIASLVSFFRS